MSVPQCTSGFERTTRPWSEDTSPFEPDPSTQNIRLSPPPHVELAVHQAVDIVVGEDEVRLFAAQLDCWAEGAHFVQSHVDVSAMGS